MSLRTINSPGVQINEADQSSYTTAIVGTNCLVQGFADKGEEYNPISISNMDDFTSNFGKPTNEAERYFYYTSNEVIRNGGNLVAAKLPYNNTITNNYKYIGINIDTGSAITTAAPTDVKHVSGYFAKYAEITNTSTLNIATSAYDAIKAGGDLTGSQSSYDYIIVNENKARITGADGNEGIFVTIIDPVDGMKIQRMFPNPSDSDTFMSLTGLSYPTGISYADFAAPLTGTYIGQSVSEDLVRKFPTIEWLDNGTSIDPYYSQQLGILVCNTSADPNNEGKLNVGILEAFVGSIHKDKKNPATGQSIYIADIINSNSQYVKMYGKLNNSSSLPSSTATDTVLYKKDDAYSLIGFTDAEAQKLIVGGTIVNNMKVVLEKVSNIDDIQLDIVVDGGLSTISEFTDTNGTSGMIYDPTTSTIGEITSSANVENWRNVCSELITFCADVRKDCMAVLDVPRNIVLAGNEKYIRKTAPTNTFSNKIGNKLRYITGLNSSYAALYSNWNKAVDDFTGVSYWLPATSKATGIYCKNDRLGNIWDAPAGLNRGVITGITDLSFNPNSKESDQLYIKSINYAKLYPLDGFILEGQKTTQVKPSAFDRVNVRRLFLRLERLAYSVARYYVMQPNNAYTRRSLVDSLEPTFKAVKNAGGIYDYMIIADETNNTPEVIDRNELKVAIMVSPTKTAEFIIIDFVATKTGANMTEIAQQLTI